MMLHRPADSDNIVLVAVKLADELHRPVNAAKERRGAHSSSDREIPAIVGQIEKPVAIFDARYFLAKVHRPGIRPHTPTPVPEQAGIGCETISSGKLNLRFNSGRLAA